MARIRTVKPELFRHEGLYDLEKSTGLPIRLAWIGLFSIADREGRFKWRPRAIKSEVMPYDDDVDFEHVLLGLEAYGFLACYEVEGEAFGVIPSFKNHQCINIREAQTQLPAPPAEILIAQGQPSRHIPEHIKRIVLTRARTCVSCGSTDDLQFDHIHPWSKGGTHDPENLQILCKCCNLQKSDHVTEMHVQARGEGKGKEGKGKEREGKIAPPSRDEERTSEVPTLIPKEPPKPKEPPPTNATWEAYSEAYRQRYHVDPTRNATVNGQLANFVKRVPAEEAPAIAAFYVEHNHGLYLNSGHAIGLLLRDAEKLRTEWLTGKRITRNTVRAVETSDHFATQLKEIAEGRL